MTLRFVRLALLTGAGVLGACTPYVAEKPGEPRGTPPPQTPSRPHYTINDPAQYPRNAEAVSGSAVMKLLQQSRVELSSNKPEQAVATLELALNIEPRNPFVWQALAEAHLARHLPEEAEHVAVRSNSFARGNPWVEVANWRTIAQARAQRGDTAGAEEANGHYDALQARLSE
jgi:predicted Zn-dependent protease